MKCDVLDDSSVCTHLFGQRFELLPSVTELFELDMAYLEQKTLDEKAIIERSAFFKTVKGKPTRHFLQCSRMTAVVQGRSSAAKTYFEEGQFSTGYATHGLFPYRGKFHPQLIRGILNVIGVREAELCLSFFNIGLQNSVSTV
jgi:hypothetical protein